MGWAKELAEKYRVADGRGFRLKDFDPTSTGHFKSKEHAKILLEESIGSLAERQNKLYASNQWGVLLVFQGMDAAGKDGLIKHVMSGVNPQGCQVHSFKVPSEEEQDHDFLWRAAKALPARGQIGIFNRSYYEETLVVRVHPEALKREKLPERLVTKNIWAERFKDIAAFERYLNRNGIVVRKFFLNLSKGEQKRRFAERLGNPQKNWKFSPHDAEERQYWGAYQKAYEDMIRHTSTRHSPWHVVPADNKWYTRLVVAATVVNTLDRLHLAYPKTGPEKQKELAEARRLLK